LEKREHWPGDTYAEAVLVADVLAIVGQVITLDVMEHVEMNRKFNPGGLPCLGNLMVHRTSCHRPSAK
jgi:hypothetical protein